MRDLFQNTLKSQGIMISHTKLWKLGTLSLVAIYCLRGFKDNRQRFLILINIIYIINFSWN